ncbi:MAG: hypothetical protein JKY24_07570 [Pseudomonadales bacterium]|nr:hypothetical protein [Pseudomonadales bacterium]
MAMDEIPYRYSFCKASWGMSIELIATKVNKSTFNDKYIAINEMLWISKKLDWLSDRERYYLDVGCKIQEGGELTFRDKGELIFITNVEFNPADYQEEGLAMVVAGWIEMNMGLRSKSIEVSFDKESNKYVFESSFFK